MVCRSVVPARVCYDGVERKATLAAKGKRMAKSDSASDFQDRTVVERFRAAWGSGERPTIESLLPPPGDPTYLATLEALVATEIECAWAAWADSSAPAAETVAGPPPLESHLRRFPPLNRPEIVLRLVEVECTVRKRHGQSPILEDYRRRFPELFEPGGHGDTALHGLVDTLPPGPPAGESLPEFEMSATAVLAGPGAETVRTPGPGSMGLGRFGNYELLEEIGRGGMGVVYRARQMTANRIVALKVIRRDRLEALPRDSQTSALDRFRNEAQAAGRLEHDNIVTVYDAGEVGGDQYFSMRYVEGQSLAEVLRKGPIENRRAAGYLEPVARAVHEAHEHGILHRDLKPQNILIDAKTDRALVADFGLAKLSEGAEELTRAGEVMGTPPYMSPEQAKDSATVTALTDVYALGATLYHMLTGRPPFQAATPIETLRQVIDEEPVPPRQLNAAVDLDLETVCLKCLQKEPPRRYETAAALADDLARYLRGEPIVARPVGSWERTVRWCRRNPLLAGLWGAAAVLAVGLFVAILIGYIETSRALAKAEDRYREARQVVDQFLTRVSEDTLLNEPGMQPLRKDLLLMALGPLERFLEDKADDPTLRDELARSRYRVGFIVEVTDSPKKALAYYEQARQAQEESLESRPDDPERLKALGDTLNATGRAYYGLRQFEEARKAHEEATAVRKRLVAAAPDRGESKRLLANSLMNVGVLDRDARRLADAGKGFDAAQAMRREALAGGYDSPELRRDLGIGSYYQALTASDQGKKDEAAVRFREAIAAFEKLLDERPSDLANQRSLVTCYRMLADVLWTSDRAAAIDQYGKAVKRAERLAWANPDVPEYQVDLAGLYSNLGLSYDQAGEIGPATAAYAQAADALGPVVDRYPGVPRYRWDLAKTLQQAGVAKWRRGRAAAAHDPAAAKADLDAAKADFDAARGHLAILAGPSADNPDYAAELGRALANLGGLAKEQKDAAGALDYYRKSLAVLEPLVEKNPKAASYREECVRTLRALAQLQSEDRPTARRLLEAAKGHLETLLEQLPARRALYERDLRQVQAKLDGLGGG